MNRIVIVITCALTATALLQAQGSVKPPSTNASGLGKKQAASNEDTNIRAYIELLRTDLKKSKAEVIGQVMALDPDQAAKFWPIYKEFQNEATSLGDQTVALIKQYSDNFEKMTDSVAGQLGDSVLSIEQQRNALKKKYYDRLKEAVGAITATRFLQVENQVERLLDLQIAAQLPIIGEQ